MPIYEYQCKTCGGYCEILQKLNDPPASECPHCHADDLKKLISAAGFHLKGTGWYVTDFRDKEKKKAKPKETDKKTTEKTKETKKNKEE